MKRLFLALIVGLGGLSVQAQELPFDPMHWQVELPTGYKASDWKLSNFQKDRFAKPFLYLDSVDGALVMEAYPAEGKSKAKYTKNSMREQLQPGSNDVNWTMKDGGILEAEFQVAKMSRNESGKYHRTILFQVDGRTSEEQTEDLGLKKPMSMPLLKIYWQNERLKIAHKVLKDESLVGDQLFNKKSWKEAKEIYSEKKVGFDKVRIKIEVKRRKILITIDDEKPIVIRDLSLNQWYFENYFSAGNYLQTKDANAHSIIKFYQLTVSHED